MVKKHLDKLLHEEMLHFADRIEDILESHNLDSDDVVYVKFFLSTMTHEDAMRHTIAQILPWKSQIEKREDRFFYKNKEIFGKLPENKVNYFSDLWMDSHLSKDDREEIWDFFDSFVAYAEEYKKRN